MAKTRDELERELELGLFRETAGYGKAKSQIQGFMDADTAPLVEAPEVPGADVSFLGALGAALRGGQAVDDLLARQSAAEDREAQMNLTAGLANQQQKGYLGMRQQEREGLMSGLDKEIIKAQARIDDMKFGMDLGPIEAKDAFNRQKELLKLQGEMDAKNSGCETPADAAFRELDKTQVDDFLLAIETMKGPELVAIYGAQWGIQKPERGEDLRNILVAAVKGKLRGLSPQLKKDYVEALQDALKLHPIKAPERPKGKALGAGPGPAVFRHGLNPFGRGQSQAGEKLGDLYDDFKTGIGVIGDGVSSYGSAIGRKVSSIFDGRPDDLPTPDEYEAAD